MTTLYVFLVLQFFDFATTLLFLQNGVGEANPVVDGLIRVFARPTVALLVVKFAGCGIAVYAWRSGRTRFLRRANLFFALCVCWNLLAIAGA